MPDEFRIDTPYLPGEKGCRLTWIIAEDEEKTLYVRHEDLNELKELLNHGSTGKIEMEDGASSILVNSDVFDGVKVASNSFCLISRSMITGSEDCPKLSVTTKETLWVSAVSGI